MEKGPARIRCFEWILLTTAMLAGAGALVAAIFTETKFKELNDVEKTIVEQISRFSGQDDLFVKTEAMAGLVFAISGIALLIGFIALVGRIFNVNHPGSTSRIFIALFLLYVLVCFLGYGAAGILGVFNAMDWSDILSSSLSGLISVAQFTGEVENIRTSVAATSACSLLTALLYGLLEVVVLLCTGAVKNY